MVGGIEAPEALLVARRRRIGARITEVGGILREGEGAAGGVREQDRVVDAPEVDAGFEIVRALPVRHEVRDVVAELQPLLGAVLRVIRSRPQHRAGEEECRLVDVGAGLRVVIPIEEPEVVPEPPYSAR